MGSFLHSHQVSEVTCLGRLPRWSYKRGSNTHLVKVLHKVTGLCFIQALTSPEALPAAHPASCRTPEVPVHTAFPEIRPPAPGFV